MEDIFKEPGIKELLAQGLEAIGKKPGHYSQDSQAIIGKLKEFERSSKRPYVSKFLVDLRGVEKRVTNSGARWGMFVRDVLNATPDQVILVSAGLFPQINHQRFQKKGATLKLPRNYKQTVEEARKQRFQEVKTGSVYVGYDWKGHHSVDQKYRVTTLVDCFKGHVLARTLNKRKIKTPTQYWPGNLETNGVLKLEVKGIPSLSSNTTYTVVLKHIPAYKRGEESVAQMTYDLDQHHGRNAGQCEKSEWHSVKDSRGNQVSIFSGERTGSEILFDYHVITAYKRAITFLKRKGLEVINPFADPTRIRNGENFFNRLGKVVKEVSQPEGVRRYHLDTLEREVALWQLIGYNNFLDTHRKRRRTT